MEDKKPEERNMTYEERLEAEKSRNKVNILKEWKTDEWILPELQEFTAKKRKFLDLDLKNDGLRAHLLPTSVANSDFVSLITTGISHISFLQREQEKRERERDYGTGNKASAAQQHGLRLKTVAKNNKDAWTVNYKKAMDNFESRLEELVKEVEVKEEEKESK